MEKSHSRLIVLILLITPFALCICLHSRKTRSHLRNQMSKRRAMKNNSINLNLYFTECRYVTQYVTQCLRVYASVWKLFGVAHDLFTYCRNLDIKLSILWLESSIQF